MARASNIVWRTLGYPRPERLAWRTHGAVKRQAESLVAGASMCGDIRDWAARNTKKCSEIWGHMSEYGSEQKNTVGKCELRVKLIATLTILALESAVTAQEIAECGLYLAMTISCTTGLDEDREQVLVAAALAMDSELIHGKEQEFLA